MLAALAETAPWRALTESAPCTPQGGAGSSLLPASHDDDDAASVFKIRKRRLGNALVLLVVLLYVGSGVAIQLLFDELNYEKPFFFSYVSVALCSTYLLHSSLLTCSRLVPDPTSDRVLYSKVSADAEATSLVHQPMLLLRPALLLAPSYFCLNYTYFLSLDLTSVSSTMILSASTGLWTLLFSRLLLNQRMTRLKMATVLVSIIGMCVVTYSVHDHGKSSGGGGSGGGGGGGHSGGGGSSSRGGGGSGSSGGSGGYSGYSGDLLALMSAAASGVYMVLLRVVVPDEDSVHMPSLFGMIGLVCAVAALPLFPLLHYGGIETFELPPTQTATLALLLNAATSTVLPDMLLAQAVVMTSPLVATLGLSLMIPLSVVADYVRGLARLSPQFFVGSIAVFVGFQLESWAELHESKSALAEAEQRRGERSSGGAEAEEEGLNVGET